MIMTEYRKVMMLLAMFAIAAPRIPNDETSVKLRMVLVIAPAKMIFMPYAGCPLPTSMLPLISAIAPGIAPMTRMRSAIAPGR